MKGRFNAVLAPGTIGSVELANRFLMAAMDQNLCDSSGLLTEANLDHYEQRAAGGVGAVIVETSAVSYPVGATSRHQPCVSTDECLAGFKALSDRVHAHGTKLFVQICHHGKTALVDTLEGRPLLIPSAPIAEMNWMGLMADLTSDEIGRIGGRMKGNVPRYREATLQELAGVVHDFSTAAQRLKSAGVDGVEIHAAHGYLLSTFLSPFWNRRSDGYGATVEGRTRLLREVVAGVRDACGDGFAIIVRLDGCEFGIEGGITPGLAALNARAAVHSGADAIHVSAIGSPDSGVAFTDGPLPWLPSQYRDITRVVKGEVDVPVIAVGRIDADTAQKMVSGEEADFIALGRQLLADPVTVNRLKAGRQDLVRPCINCFVCVAQNFWDATPRCAVNARLGRDVSRPTLVERPLRVGVVGAGPAGLEAARVAAERGHDVTLFERSSVVGGTARISAVTTPINLALVDYLIAAVRDAGVKVRTNTTVTGPSVIADGFDRVIVATGAQRGRPAVAGADLDHVLTGDDMRSMLEATFDSRSRSFSWTQRLVLRMAKKLGLTEPSRVRSLSRWWMPVSDTVVVLGGGLVGIEIAEFLAERGRSVTVLESGETLGGEMAHPRRWRALHRARAEEVRLVTQATVVEITPSEVLFSHQDQINRVDAGHVIVAEHVEASAPLAAEIEATGVKVEVIGDAAQVGYIEGAIRSGFDAALLL